MTEQSRNGQSRTEPEEKQEPTSTAAVANGNVTVLQDPDDPDMVIIRTRKRERKKHRQKRMNPKLRIAIIVIAVIAGLLVAAGTALAIAVNVGNVNLHQVFKGSENMPEEVTVQDEGQTVEYNGHTYRYNENIVSFLLIGHDDESGYVTRANASCADANVLFTLDTETKQVHAIVVPRNSWVPVDLYDENENYVATRDLQLTLSHAVLLDTIDKCAANTTKSVSRIFYNLPITHYIDIDEDVVREASTAVGGVTVEALETIPGQGYSAGDTVLLEGNSALRYVQYRYTDAFESALARQDRQIQFIKAFAAKISKLGLQDLLNLYNAVSGEVTTNLGIPEVTYLASCFLAGGNGDLKISQLAGTTELYIDDADGKEYERYFLDEGSVMENTLAAFYTQVD